MDKSPIRNVNIHFKRQTSPTRSVISDGQLKLTGSQVTSLIKMNVMHEDYPLLIIIMWSVV